MYFNLFYTLFIFIYCTNATKQEWVDPSDMTPKYPDKWVDPHDMRPSDDYLKYTNNPTSLHKQQSSNPTSELYYKRAINMLLKSVHEDINELDAYSGYLYFKVKSGDYERLKMYAENMETDIDLSEINRILEGILTKPSHQHIQDFLESWFHKLLNVVFSRQGIIAIVMLSYIYVIYQMIRAKHNLQYIFTFIFINIFIYDFIFTWIRLYKDNEIDQMVFRSKYNKVPVECNPEFMNTWQFLVHLTRVEDDCQKYHQAVYQDIFWKVSPGAVLTDMFARSIEQPASAVGNAFATVCASIYNKFSWPMNILIFPIAMIFFCLMSMILLSIVFNRNIHFNFFHLFSVSNTAGSKTTQVIHEKQTNNDRDRLTDGNVERLLRIAEGQQQQLKEQLLKGGRVFVEEVKVIQDPTISGAIKETESNNENEPLLLLNDKDKNKNNEGGGGDA